MCTLPLGESARRRVLVIGAGQSGIVTAHYLSQDNENDITVVEKEGDLGGVWHPHKQFPNLRANNARDTFTLPDLPALQGTSDFPSLYETHAYLKRYVEEFDLEKFIHYNVKVERISRKFDADTPFNVTFDVEFHDADSANVKNLDTSYEVVVVATGYTSTPHIPTISGSQKFTGLMLHTSEINTKFSPIGDATVEKKNVVILGGGKSALDAAVWAAQNEAATVHLVTRCMHWAAPRYIGGPDPRSGDWNQNILYSRFSQMFLPTCVGCHNPLKDVPVSSWLMHETTIGRTIRDLFWTVVTSGIKKQFDYPSWLVPPHEFVDDVKYLSILHPDIISLMKTGRIKVHLCRRIAEFTSDSVSLAEVSNCTVPEGAPKSSNSINADVIIFGTGFKSSAAPILSSEIREKLFNEHGQIQLLRGAHNPNMPGMGFVGFKHTINSMLTSALSARWVAEYVKGTDGAISRNGVLDDIEEVWRQIRQGNAFERTIMARQTPTQKSDSKKIKPYGGLFQGNPIYPYSDAIMRDLGLESVMSSSWIEEFNAPQLNTLYAGLDQKLRNHEQHENVPFDATPFFVFLFLGVPTMALVSLLILMWMVRSVSRLVWSSALKQQSHLKEE